MTEEQAEAERLRRQQVAAEGSDSGGEGLQLFED